MQDKTEGINKFAMMMQGRMKEVAFSPAVLDFGQIQDNGNLKTNLFEKEIPKGDYLVCRSLRYGKAGGKLTEAVDSSGQKMYDVTVPKCMESLVPGDRVLVAWVQKDAVIIDIIN